MQAQKIIVIQPGSLNLRIGRASDLNPITVLHAIGRRRRRPKDAGQTDSNSAATAHFHHDSMLPPLQSEALAEFEEQRRQVSHAIQALAPHQGAGAAKRQRIATPPQQISTFNRRSVPVELSEGEEEVEELKKEKSEKEDDQGKEQKEKEEEESPLFDQELLQMPDLTAKYNLHFPLRRGELHLHAGIGGSLVAVLADLEAIWLWALRERLGIAVDTLPQYGAVLLIADVYQRPHLRELLTLLLQRMRFRACFLLQENIAATFGGGLGAACVVDMGDQKCSVSCVEDGISHPQTRVRLPFGGGDVSQVFGALLRKCCFPYKECDAEAYLPDAALLQSLKERFCHVRLDVCGAQERQFDVISRNGVDKKRRLRYTLQLGDECIVAPLSLFHTELLNITDHRKQQQARLQLRSSQQPDPEDCFDAEYIRETGRRNGGRDTLMLDNSALGAGVGGLPVTGDIDELVVVDAYDAAAAANEAKERRKQEEEKEDAATALYTNAASGQIVPLDQTIVRSIERCASDEMKRKMYASILLVGGGSKFAGFAAWLEQKVRQQLAATMATATATATATPSMVYEVNVLTKEMDAAIIAWKGAAIMSCLESAPELWIYAAEWEKYGLRILREKAPFIW